MDNETDKNAIIRKSVRVGRAEESRKIAAAGDDALIWPEFANEDDAFLEW